MRRWMCLAGALIGSTAMMSAEAHAHLRGATPAPGSVVAAAPSRIVLDFSEAARLTAAWISRNDGTREKLGPLPQQASAEIAVPLPALAPGQYVISWRVVGDDGHIVPGQLRFTVAAAGAAAPH
jgi:methionine-rich copper-binding protein CopC